MKQRILVAVIGIPLLLLVLCWLPHWATAALLAALGVIGAHELLAAVSGPEKTKRLWVLAGVLAVLTVFATYAGREEYKGTVLVAAPWLLCAAAALLFLLAVRWYGRENAVAFQDICAVLLGGVAIPLAMSCLLRLRMLEQRRRATLDDIHFREKQLERLDYLRHELQKKADGSAK